jgi:hypothetical protein
MPQERHTRAQEVTKLDRRGKLLRDPGYNPFDLSLFSLGQEHAFLTIEFIWLRDRRP